MSEETYRMITSADRYYDGEPIQFGKDESFQVFLLFDHPLLCPTAYLEERRQTKGHSHNALCFLLTHSQPLPDLEVANTDYPAYAAADPA